MHRNNEQHTNRKNEVVYLKVGQTGTSGQSPAPGSRPPERKKRDKIVVSTVPYRHGRKAAEPAANARKPSGDDVVYIEMPPKKKSTAHAAREKVVYRNRNAVEHVMITPRTRKKPEHGTRHPLIVHHKTVKPDEVHVTLHPRRHS